VKEIIDYIAEGEEFISLAINKTKRKELEQERDFYKLRVEALERIKHDFPEPYKTWVINILANGKSNHYGK